MGTLAPRRPELDIAPFQRRRIIDGATEAVALLGPQQAKIADLVRFAACARKTFYTHFTGKDACLRSMLDHCCTSAHSAALEGSVAGLLEHLREHPAAARVICLESWRIDPEVMIFHMGEFTKLLNAEPTPVDEMRIGAAFHVIAASIRGGGVEQLPPAPLIRELLSP